MFIEGADAQRRVQPPQDGVRQQRPRGASRHRRREGSGARRNDTGTGSVSAASQAGVGIMSIRHTSENRPRSSSKDKHLLDGTNNDWSYQCLLETVRNNGLLSLNIHVFLLPGLLRLDKTH